MATGGFDLEQLPVPLDIGQPNWRQIDDSWFEVGIEDPLTGRTADVYIPVDLALRTTVCSGRPTGYGALGWYFL